MPNRYVGGALEGTSLITMPPLKIEKVHTTPPKRWSRHCAESHTLCHLHIAVIAATVKLSINELETRVGSRLSAALSNMLSSRTLMVVVIQICCNHGRSHPNLV